MERLVLKSKVGSLYFNDTEWGLKLEPHEIEPHQRRLLLKRLYEYEDAGLTPEEIREVKERDTAKMCKQSIFDHDSITCVCGSDMDKDVEFKFCPWCGQALDTENLEGMEDE